MEIVVAAGQLRPCPKRSLRETVDIVLGMIRESGQGAVDILAFPEVCLPGYHPDCLDAVSQVDLSKAETEISTECAAAGVAVIIGK